MIVVLGSRHDPVAVSLVAAWPSAELCSAEDLTRRGWAWSSDAHAVSGVTRWVVGGRVVDDAQVSGVFVRRSAVYAEELLGTHPADRAYLAAEAHALLVFVLSATRATVANPVVDGGIGDEALRHERVMSAAVDARVAIAPLALASRSSRRASARTSVVDVAADEPFGAVPARRKDAALRLARRLDVHWASFVFDERGRLVAATSSRAPGPAARTALERLLATRLAA